MSGPGLGEQLVHQKLWPDSFLQFVHRVIFHVGSHDHQLPSAHSVTLAELGSACLSFSKGWADRPLTLSYRWCSPLSP